MKASSPRKSSQPLMEMFLRITHPNLDPETITETLELQPEECIKKGTTSSSTGGTRLHSESYWIAELSVSSLAELAGSFTAMSAGNVFTQPGRIELKSVLGATEHDFLILGWLKRLDGRQAFFSELNRTGGSATLLIQRNDVGAPISLRRSLKKLDELGIGLEIE